MHDYNLHFAKRHYVTKMSGVGVVQCSKHHAAKLQDYTSKLTFMIQRLSSAGLYYI